MKRKPSLVPIDRQILVLRGGKVILDEDLAAVYGVTTQRLNEAVKRNIHRFPQDFLFRLTKSEWNAMRSLRSQNATLESGRGKHRKYLPYAFTEHGALMAANVLKSRRAVEMSVFVVRAFVRLREIALAHRELAEKLKQLESAVGQHDLDIQAIIKALRQLMAPPAVSRKEIGFRVKEPKVRYGSR